MFDTLSGRGASAASPGAYSLDGTTISAIHPEGDLAGAPDNPLAVIFCSDLMFAIRLRNMARKTGYRVASALPGTDIRSAAVLLVDIADRGDWETIIRQAGDAGIATIAFGPHMDTVARRRAKGAGAARVLANSNLERDLPGILVGVRDSLNTQHGRARGTEG
jgi:hypothetical protein